MGLTNAGRDLMVQAVKSSLTHIGVGSDSATAFAVGQTDLIGTSKTRKAIDSVTGDTNALTFQATFATGDANHDWKEWGVFNASTAGVMFSRKVENLGTKTSGTWVLTVTVTINN